MKRIKLKRVVWKAVGQREGMSGGKRLRDDNRTKQRGDEWRQKSGGR